MFNLKVYVMRKITFILFAFFIYTANAQIQNKIYNCTLGKTSFSQVVNNVNNKGYIPLPYEDFLFANNVSWGGVKWAVATFQFDESRRLVAIRFLIDETTTPKNKIYYTFEQLKKKLQKKYFSYMVNDDEGIIRFVDKITGLNLIYHNNEDNTCVELQYMYFPYFVNEYERGNNEL